MAQPYIGEIRIFAGTFAPAGWAFCDGALLPIAEYETLFVLIGTTYGGDGQATFALPDLRGRFAVAAGNGPGLSPVVLAETGGLESVTLTAAQLPAHTHPIGASTGVQTSNRPTGAYQGTGNSYSATHDTTAVATDTAGGGAAHENRPPFLAINYIISLFGIFPSPT
jgi:microcystin-dependent protein